MDKDGFDEVLLFNLPLFTKSETHNVKQFQLVTNHFSKKTIFNLLGR